MLRILLVDDEPTVRFAITSYLSGRDFAVDQAEDLASARARLDGNDYDVVITDLRLGGDSDTEGLDVIRDAVRKTPLPRTILMTAFGSPEVEAEATALGVSRYIEKPFELDALVRMIQSLM